MTFYSVSNPFPLVLNLQGTGLNLGHVYFGVAGQDPITNPKTVYWNIGGTDVAAQPIPTSGGYYYRSGTPANVFVDSTYSIKVLDKNGALVFYEANVYDPVFQIAADLAAFEASLASAAGAGIVGFSQANTYAQGTEGLHGQAVFSVKDAPFNAKGDGTTDDTNAIKAAILFAQATRRSIFFPPGDYPISSTIPLDTNPVSFVGDEFAHFKDGSASAPVALKWTGGASPMFTCSTSGFNFVGIAIDNVGTATDFMDTSLGLQFVFSRLSINPTVPFSRSVFHTSVNNYGYSQFNGIHSFGAAPQFLHIESDGLHGIAPITFGDRCIFESNDASDMTVFASKNCNFDSVVFRGCTFNQQTGKLVIVDTSDTPTAVTLSTFVFSECEIDVASSVATDRLFNLVNCPNIILENNNIQGGSVVTGLVKLVNSRVVKRGGNFLYGINGPLFDADATSYVTPHGIEYPTLGNTFGIVAPTILSSGIIQVALTSNVATLPGYLVDQGDAFRVDVPSATDFFISYANTADSSGYFVRGQVFTLVLRNTSGGALGICSMVGGDTVWKIAGNIATPPAVQIPVARLPAAGQSRSYTFVCEGASFREITPADVPN